MKVLKLLALSTFFAASPLMAGDFELSLTNESAKGLVNFTSPQSNIDLAGGYTYHEGRRHLFNVDFHAKGRTAIGNLPTTAGIGVQGIAWDNDDRYDGGALGIGGFAHITLPEIAGLSLRIAGHYAPKILSFSDSEEMISFESTVNYRVIRNADVFAGYRLIETELDLPRKPDLRLDDGLLAGLRIYF